MYIYNVNYFAGIIVSSSCYYILCLVFPVPETSNVWFEAPPVEDEVMDAEGDDPESNYVSKAYTEDDGDKNVLETSKRVF